jgi:adenine-specific DNA-methyltransferase
MTDGGVVPYYQDEFATLYKGDCFELMQGFDDGSFGMVFADPPYFRVKGDWWDNQWDTAAGFLDWVGLLAVEWRRVLAGNGSLYCFASPKMGARVEVKLGESFNVLTNVRWQKPPFSTKAEMFDKAKLRSFFPASETIVFAEQFGQDTSAGGEYTAAEVALRASVFEPLRLKLVKERDAAGLTNAQVDACLGTAGMAGHYFGASQWKMPTAEAYAKIQRLANGEHFRAEFEHLRAEFEHLRAEFEHLRAEFEHLRRPFNATPDAPYTDVWSFPTVKPYKGKHPCEKPQELIRHAVSMSHRADSLPILDTFAGTGSTLLAASAMGRKSVGMEISEEYCEAAALRLERQLLGFEQQGLDFGGSGD